MPRSCSCLLLLVFLDSALAADPPRQPQPNLSAPTITAQHPNGERYIVVPNNWRMRMFANHVQEAADAFAADRKLIPVRLGDELLRIPQEAFLESPPSPANAVSGMQKWDEATKSYVPFAGSIDSRYFPFMSGPANPYGSGLTIDQLIDKNNEGRRAMSAQYLVYGFPHKTTPLAYAGQGLFNEPANDVWVRDPKGTSFFVDGNEWVEVLKMMASDGEGGVPSFKPDIWDLIKLNQASRMTGIAKSVAIFAVIGAIAFAVFRWYRKRKPAA